jgi:hydroxyethylthiazole kinase-like uncharacterized protein yjeF
MQIARNMGETESRKACQMTELLTAAQMRALEQAAIESGDVTGLDLMERAGRGVVNAVFEEWPELARAPHRAVVLCGPGNNGGDGFVVARLLKDWGWEVEVFLYGNAEKLPPDAKVNYERWCEMGEVDPLEGDLEPSQRKPALVIDAMFGTGLSRPVEGFGLLFLDLHDSQGLGARMPEADRPPCCPRLVSIDMPSGLCSDSGKVLLPKDFEGLPDKLEAASACSDLTVTFHSKKTGHHLDDGPELCGVVRVVDIGLNTQGKTSRQALARVQDEEDGGGTSEKPHLVRCGLAEQAAIRLRKTGEGHKYSYGHALILSGGAGRTGAARLAARGALRIGSGLVTLGVPGAAQQEVASQSTALMLTRVEIRDSLSDVLEDARLNALCLGPGLGIERARDLVPPALGEAGVKPHPTRSVVLDADALTAFEDAPETLFDMLHDRCVLTPHAGEFARLFPDIAERLNATPTKGPAYSKVDATREAAKRAGCVVLFKGPDTVIAAPDGRCSINSAQYERAAPWLATAGAGDVLAGFITGLLARGLGPMDAAETAAWLHVECALAFGPGLIAEDLPEALPGVFRSLDV